MSHEEVLSVYFSLKGNYKPELEAFFFARYGRKKMFMTLENQTYLSIVDLRKSRNEVRFFVLNMQSLEVEYAGLTGHGKKSGVEFATAFSNENGSNQTSLGFYKTSAEIRKARTKDRSGLLLEGLEKSNDNARKRGIFIHPAGVDQSEGCFTLPMSQEEANIIMQKIVGGSLLFAYYPDQEYLVTSNLLH